MCFTFTIIFVYGSNDFIVVNNPKYMYGNAKLWHCYQRVAAFNYREITFPNVTHRTLEGFRVISVRTNAAIPVIFFQHFGWPLASPNGIFFVHFKAHLTLNCIFHALNHDIVEKPLDFIMHNTKMHILRIIIYVFVHRM